MMDAALNKLMKLNLVKLKLPSFYFNEERRMNILKQISALSSLNEYKGTTKSNALLKMTNINHENRNDFKNLILRELEIKSEAKKGIEMQNLLENTSRYYLLKHIKIKEY